MHYFLVKHIIIGFETGDSVNCCLRIIRYLVVEILNFSDWLRYDINKLRRQHQIHKVCYDIQNYVKM